MIRTNLATRPFYNERAVHIVLALAAVVVVGFTAWTVGRLVSLSARHTALAAEIRRDEAAAAAHRQAADAIRRRIDPKVLELTVAQAREANALIDQRAFSWTEFFNLIERTLPGGVRLSSVAPHFEQGITSVTMVVTGRRAEDIDAFMERLEATGAFTDVLPRTEDFTEEGLHRTVIVGRYLGGAGAPAARAVERSSR